MIIGGGPAGLATSQQLAERGVNNLVLERGEHPGWMWSHVYHSLRLHTGKHLSALPGMPFPRGTSLFPSLEEFRAYLRAYAQRFDLPVNCGIEAQSAGRDGDTWQIATSGGCYESRILVVATGIMSAPRVPDFVSLDSLGGGVIHSSDYRTPHDFLGQRVLVAGIGNSGAEIASELADAGVEVSVSVRSGADVVPRSIAGVPTQYLGWALSQVPGLPVPAVTRALGAARALLGGGRVVPGKRTADGCSGIPLIGTRLVSHVRSGKIDLIPELTSIGKELAGLSDGTERQFDRIILATGYRAAIDWLEGWVSRDQCGFAHRTNRVCSAEHDGLYFVGHNYDGRGGLCNIAIDARRVARLAARIQERW